VKNAHGDRATRLKRCLGRTLMTVSEMVYAAFDKRVFAKRYWHEGALTTNSELDFSVFDEKVFWKQSSAGKLNRNRRILRVQYLVLFHSMPPPVSFSTLSLPRFSKRDDLLRRHALRHFQNSPRSMPRSAVYFPFTSRQLLFANFPQSRLKERVQC
jgi:hypothetical protein